MEESSGAGASENNGEETRTEKAYCCSNYPQTEATLIAKFDLTLEAIGLLTFAVSIATLSNKPSPDLISQHNTSPQNAAFNDSIKSDPSMFFYWPRSSQLLVMSLCLVCCAVGIIFSIILWIGIRRKNHAFLLVWFIFTLTCLLIFVIIGIVVIFKASEKVMLSVGTVSFFFYKWYCLWIVKLLMSEIRAVPEGYTNPLDDGEIYHTDNLVPSSDSFIVDKF